MGPRSEVAEMAENAVWHGTEGAQAYLAVRRAPEVSTDGILQHIGDCSSGLMNNAG